MSTEIERHDDTPGAEVVQLDGQVVSRRDLRNAATDSWTSVLVEVGQLAQGIANTDMVGKEIRGNVGAVSARILYAREVGLGPMQGLTQLHNVEGKVGMSAEAMRALVLQAGHEIDFPELTSARVTMRGRRRGQDAWTSVTWTLDDAKRAKLVGKFNWQAYPRHMLQARATADLCRLIFADVIHGLVAIEEYDEVIAIGGGTAETEAPAKKPAKVTRKSKTPTAEPPAPPIPDQGPPAAPTAQAAPPAPPAPPAPAPPPPPAPPAPKAAPKPPEPDPVPDDEPMPEPPPEDDDPNVWEGEVIEDAEPRATQKQLALLLVRFKELEVVDRAERMHLTAKLIGRQVNTSKDITRREAGNLIDAFARCQSRGDLDILISHGPL